MATRRIASRTEAETFLRQAVRQAGVRKVLLVGGDAAEPVGPYSDSAALLNERLLSDCGIQHVGLAGYPEGHPRIATERLSAALDAKLALAEAQGIGAYVLTQFSFAPTRIVEYCAAMARRAPHVAIYVGLAGPSSPRTLIRSGITGAVSRFSSSSFSVSAAFFYSFTIVPGPTRTSPFARSHS